METLFLNNFIFFSFKYFLFYSTLYLMGRGIFILYFNNFKDNISKNVSINIYNTLPIVGIFFLGNMLTLFNFFIPLNSKVNFLIFSILLLNFKNIIYVVNAKKLLIKFFIHGVLLLSSYNIYFHYDAGLYHLGHQLLLSNNNLIIGISNIYGPYGVGSILEYISSFFWFDKTYNLLHFISILFAAFFFEFLFDLINNKKHSYIQNIGIALLLFAFLDNFGRDGGRNGFIFFQGIGKQDMEIAILYVSVTLLIIISTKQKDFSNVNIFLITLLTLFIFQLKVSGSVVLLFYIFYLYELYKSKVSLKLYFKNSAVFIAFGVMWVIKSILSTGCFVFPSVITCLNFSWVDKKYIKTIEDVSIQYSNSFNFDSSFVKWFENYVNLEINKTILLNFFISYIFIYFVIFKSSGSDHHRKTNFKINLILFLSLLFFLKFGPDPRYLMGIQMLFVSIIGVSRLMRFQFKLNYLYVLFVFSLILFNRLDTYRNFDFFTFPTYEIPKPETTLYDERYYPLEGDQCWISDNCSSSLYEYKVSQEKYFKIVKLKD